MNESFVVSALDARTNFGKLLRRVEEEGQSLVIEKQGMPRAVLLSIRAYMRLAVPEHEVLRIIGKESKLKGTNRLSAAQIDKVIKPPGIPSVDDPRSGSYAAVFRFAAADTTALMSTTSLLASPNLPDFGTDRCFSAQRMKIDSGHGLLVFGQTRAD